MSLVINHNLMAMNAARNLGNVFGQLATSTQRLSSGLRINSAADDAAGLAIRELMRADIAVLNQGSRNAADAISMIQTAEGALSVIDEKLIRMKELAEQAATGTYTTVQREIMDSEYQAMAAEIDRIANATDFNGIKLLDGSLSSQHDGSGIKIHFGTGNVSTEDYYFVNIADSRATVATGLQVGGGATRDVLVSDAQWSDPANNVSNLNTANSAWVSFYYDNDGDNNVNQTVTTNPSNLVGAFRADGSLEELVTDINQGAAARVQITFSSATGTAVVSSASGAEFGFSIGEGANATKVLLYNSQSANGYSSGVSGTWDVKVDVDGVTNIALTVASAINATNSTTSGQTFAIANGNNIFLFAKETGTGGNQYQAIEMNSAGVAGNQANVYLVDVATGSSANGSNSMYFNMGGQQMITAAAVNDGSAYKLQVSGVGRGPGYDVSVVDFADRASGFYGMGWAEGLSSMDAADDFTETQNSSGQAWAGGDILTQSAAQQALDQIQSAILNKDKTRAGLGALQNRLENTMTNIAIQAEMLQSSESRISDVDVATEMTQFTRNNIMAQAATAMLSQANSAAKLALSLLG